MVNKQHTTSLEMMQSLSWKQVALDSFIISPEVDGTVRKQIVKALEDLRLPKSSRKQVAASMLRAVLDFSANLVTEDALTPRGAVHYRIFIAQIVNQVEKSVQSSLCWGFFLVQHRASQPGSQKLSLDVYLYQE